MKFLDKITEKIWDYWQGTPLWGLANRLAHKNYKYCSRCHLNGMPVWVYFRRDVFVRFARYVGHGLCYEAAALAMLAWKDHPKTRYVMGYASSHEAAWACHAWMELKAYGIWWVMDPTWVYPMSPMPRVVHHLAFHTSIKRVVEHEEFFSFPVVKEMCGLMRNPETSYLFYALTFFRLSDSHDARMVIEEQGIHLLPKKGRDNQKLTGLFGYDKPLTQQMLMEYIVKLKRDLPKAHTYRQAMRIAKKLKVNELMRAAEKERQEDSMAQSGHNGTNSNTSLPNFKTVDSTKATKARRKSA